MKWNLAGALAFLAFELSSPAPADACGVKLVVKTKTPRKTVARSSNPSRLLLVGTPPHRLERELAAAGHDVEVAPSLGDAKRTSYAVVVVDNKQAGETKAKFPDAAVVVRSGDVVADISSVEGKVARKPVRVDEGRAVVAARPVRQPIAAGPTGPKPTPVAAKEPTPPPEPTPPTVVKEPTPPAISKTVTPPTPVEPTPPAVKEPAPTKPPKTVAKVTAFRDEIYFGVARAKVAKNVLLDRAVRWLNDNPSLNVVIEGYADPTGDHAINMTLSQNRAESVRDYLIAAGIDGGRLEVTPFGDTKLKYGYADPRNRRVVIRPKP